MTGDDLAASVSVGRGHLVAESCSATTQPKAIFSFVASSSGLCRSVTITAFEPDSSTYDSSASRRSGANPSVFPV